MCGIKELYVHLKYHTVTYSCADILHFHQHTAGKTKEFLVLLIVTFDKI